MKVNATATGIEFVDAPVGSGGTWGSITGTLADQTDLQNALNEALGKPELVIGEQ